MKRLIAIAIALSASALGATALGTRSLGAQTIRGTVVDETSKLPVASVLVTMLDDEGKETLPGVRTDSVGNFVVHAARAGTWRVRAVRIGYNPMISENVPLAVGGLAVVRLRMTTVAQQLLPVQIVERRQLSANELMSTSGFDLRASRGLGKFLSGERLADMKKDGLREILATHFQPTLHVVNDAVLGDVLRMRQGFSDCAPEIFLDGRLIATAPKPRALVTGPTPRTALDSLRAVMRQDSDSMRVGYDQINALGLLSQYTAEMLHGVELYRSYEVPPVSLGAWFGMTKSSTKACGTVAVWTKAGALSVVATRRAVVPGRAVQVVTGTLLDYDTGAPLSGRPVVLLSESGDPTGVSAMTDARGDFTIRTSRSGKVRLRAGGDGGFLESTTTPFSVTSNELLLVKLFVSARQGVLTPLGIAARILPQDIGSATLAGFTYRRERAQGGAFYRAEDIARSGARTVAEILRTVEGVTVSDSPNPTVNLAGSLARRVREGSANCAPTYYLDGRAVPGNMPASISALDVNTIFGVEVYASPADFPPAFADVAGCGLIVVWTKK